MGKDRQSAEFKVAGKFLGYVFKDGYKIKRLRIATASAEYSIKMTKRARASLTRTLLPGDLIQVGGQQKFDQKTATLKLKAGWIQPLVSEQDLTSASPVAAAKPQKMSVLVCQKSGCMKRGGKEVCKALEKAIDDRGLGDQVSIKGTGCMKICGKGPNVVFMPGKTRYTKVSAKDIASLVDEHFTIVPAPVETEVVKKPAILVSV